MIVALILGVPTLLAPAAVHAEENIQALTFYRDTLFDKVMNGTATPTDIADFQKVSSIIKAHGSGVMSKYSEQLNKLIQNISILTNQNKALSDSLLGGGGQPLTPLPQTGGVSKLSPPLSAPRGPIIGQISMSPLRQQIDKLVLIAANKDLTAATAVDKYSRPLQKLLATAKDSFNYMIPYRGFAPSSEAGDVILDEKVKLKSLAAAQYAQQRLIDESHLKITTAVLEIAQGQGMSTGGEATLSKGMADLTEAVGADETTVTSEMIKGQVATAPPDITGWDVAEKQRQYLTLAKSAVEADAVISEIAAKVHKYNRHGKGSMMASHIVQPLLGALRQTPTFVGPAAAGVLTAYVMATGGPEQDKLLKELYLDKRLSCRMTLISEESHLVLDSYIAGVQSSNSVLQATAETLIQQMQTK